MRWPFSYRLCISAQKPPLAGYSFRLHPVRATLTPYTATPRSTTNSASSSFCTRSVCPICLEGEATLAHLQRVRHSAPSLDVSFLRPYSLWVGDSSHDSYWKPNAKDACAHGPRGGMPPSHEGGNRTWQTIVKYGKASAWTWKPMTSCASCARPRLRCHES